MDDLHRHPDPSVLDRPAAENANALDASGVLDPLDGLASTPSPNTPPLPPPHGLLVLASGSGGNCSILRVTINHRPHHYLIDLGLSPRRTRAALAHWSGITLNDLDGVLLTHFDSDHCHPGWCTAIEPALPPNVEVFFHRSHAGRSRRIGLQASRVAPFREAFTTPAGLPVRAAIAGHDDLGSSAFRIDTPGGSLGFATDVGRATEPLINHLRAVDVLAIESNYCPQLELSSGRSPHLIRRVMGGHGHLSNEESVAAIRAISPRSHVVLLHLSRECNRPELVHAHHTLGGYPFTISLQHQPTGWIALEGCAPVTIPACPFPPPRVSVRTPQHQQALLFG